MVSADVAQLEWCAGLALLDHVVRDFFDQAAQSVSPHRRRIVGGEHGYLSLVPDRCSPPHDIPDRSQTRLEDHGYLLDITVTLASRLWVAQGRLARNSA